ncbi:hypothetical protein DID88_001261 [Monilinia fructigena]|uniref:Uncharacterized protein n=1 Tax=Monilinia fructigena TaxID=38457 RepID=A0A395IY29_9HELO|nr:hypothetical protein DID88_001261 [Monilinia fructigena]
MTNDIRDSNLVKELAANDKKTRDAALESLRTYLSSSRDDLTPLDYLKNPQRPLLLNVDVRPPAPPTIARKLSRRPLFISAIRQARTLLQWLLADHAQRMGAHRCFTDGEIFASQKKKGKKRGKSDGSEGVGEAVLAVLEDIPCGTGPDAQRTPNGMRFHVIDIWVDELEKLGIIDAAKESEESTQKLERLLEPLRKLGKESLNKVVRNKVKEALGDERLPGNQTVEGAGEDVELSDGEEDGWGGIED